MHNVAILLLAAGASARMQGRDKLMEIIDGRPLLRRQAHAACATKSPVYVTLNPRFPGRRMALFALPVERVTVPDSDSGGMAASFRAGVAALPDDIDGVLVVLSDMPDLSQQDFDTMIRRFDGKTVLRGASVTGDAGHPVLFPRSCFKELMALEGDHGARAVAENHPCALVRLPNWHAVTDLDTPEDWAAWRAKRSHG